MMTSADFMEAILVKLKTCSSEMEKKGLWEDKDMHPGLGCGAPQQQDELVWVRRKQHKLDC